MTSRSFLILINTLFITGCSEEPVDYHLTMNNNYNVIEESLPKSNGEDVSVILLLGQSNASGCSVTQCLYDNLERDNNLDLYKKYENGYKNILINYCLEDHLTTTNGDFKPVDLTCGSTDGFFGPEVGMADYLSIHDGDQKYIILKYAMSGYSIRGYWLDVNQNRADIYNAFLPFVTTYMDYILSRGYNATIDNICWMQGESDTSEEASKLYYKNQSSLVKYMREDLKKFQNKNGIKFIDAGISDSPYCEPGRENVNNAKLKFSKESNLNYYFSTIENGLTTMNEPYMPYSEEPDYGHYDAYDEIKLGELFGEYILK